MPTNLFNLFSCGTISVSKQIFSACSDVDEKQIQTIVLKYPKSVRCLDQLGNTPLHVCVDCIARYGICSYRAVEILLLHGADPYVPNQQGVSALDISNEHNLSSLTLLLLTLPKKTFLKNPADLNATIDPQKGPQTTLQELKPKPETTKTSGSGFPSGKLYSTDLNQMFEFRAKLYELIDSEYKDRGTGMLRASAEGPILFIDDMNEEIMTENLEEMQDLKGTLFYEIVKLRNIKLILSKLDGSKSKVYLIRLRDPDEAEALYKIIHQIRLNSVHK